ncbi:MAG: helix-turn-helix domain-containing protein [Pseudomonadota bacterium]
MMLNRFQWLKAVMQSDVSRTAKNVATVLAVQFSNDDTGQCNPRQTTIADSIGAHRDAVKRAIRELKNSGWLMVLEGRGRGRQSGYRLISPGKIVSISTAKKGDKVPDEKGDEPHPCSREKGDELRGKGGRTAHPHIRQEQTYEQSARETPAARGRCPCERLALIEPGSHREEAWNEWLTQRGWPTVADLRVKYQTGFGMPQPMPPSNNDPHGIAQRITERFLAWASARMIERREKMA